MNIPKDRTPSRRLNKKARLFRILTNEPELTASQLQVRARDLNINLSLLAAYRTLRAFRESGGSLENSESRCLRVVAAVLQNCAEGEHLTAAQVQARAEAQNLSVHLATIYRVLARLISIGMVTVFDKGRQKLYEWKRDDGQHGHLTCIQCGKTIEFHQEYLDSVGKQISTRLGYDFIRIEFVVRSLCQDCQDL